MAKWLRRIAPGAEWLPGVLRFGRLHDLNHHDRNTRFALERSRGMRRGGVPSPDIWDAVALTSAEPVVLGTFHRRLEYSQIGIV